MALAPLTVDQTLLPTSPKSFVRGPGVLERAIAALLIFIFSFSLPNEWFVRVGNASAGTVQSGSPIVTLVFLAFFGFVIVSMNNNWHLVLAASKREPLFPGLLGVIVLSSIWSINPVETFTSSVVLAITFAAGIYFTVRYRLEETLWLAGMAMASGVVINFVFIFVFQQFGLDTINVGTDGGSKWSGIFVTKNELGRVASLSFIIFGFLARTRRSYFVWPFWGLLALIQVVGSDSATSLGATGGIIGLTAIFLGFRGRKTLYGATALAITTVMSTLTALAATNLAVATGLLGKDSNFTGRLPLWIDSWTIGIAGRPWFGYGWLAYWSEAESFPVRLRQNFAVPHAHNAFLDAWLFAGPIAALLLFAIYARGMVWGARNIRAVPGAVGLAPIIFISYGFVFSLTESGVVRRDISFILLVISCVTAAKNKGQRQRWVPPANKGVEAKQAL